MKKIYIVNYSSKVSESVINDKIKSLGDWFNYFPNSFLLFSSSSVQTIYNNIATNLPEDRFLILEIDLKDYWGWLPKEAWEWLNTKKSEQNR